MQVVEKIEKKIKIEQETEAMNQLQSNLFQFTISFFTILMNPSFNTLLIGV